MASSRDAETGPRRKRDGTRQRRVTPTKSTESSLEVIERLLNRPVNAMKDGQQTKVSALEAILLQLFQKSLAGDKKAGRVFQNFIDFANRDSATELEVVFVDNEYTRAFAASSEPEDG